MCGAHTNAQHCMCCFCRSVECRLRVHAYALTKANVCECARACLCVRVNVRLHCSSRFHFPFYVLLPRLFQRCTTIMRRQPFCLLRSVSLCMPAIVRLYSVFPCGRVRSQAMNGVHASCDIHSICAPFCISECVCVSVCGDSKSRLDGSH